MGTNATISLAAIIAIVGICISIYGFFRNRKSDIQSEDTKMSEIREGILKLNMKSDALCQGLNELRLDTKTQLKEISARQQDQEKELAVVKRDLETAFIRIDELKGSKHEKE